MRKFVAILAFLPLIGAAPEPQAGPGAAVECKLSFADSQKALATLNITRSSGEDPAAEGGVVQYYNPAGVTVLGRAATFYSRAEFESEGVRRMLYRVEIPGTYPEARAAMLKLHDKTSCDAHESLEPGKLGCMIHVRSEGTAPERDVDMIMFEIDGAVTTGCIFATKQ